jgi:hypothetical protein
MPDGLREQPLRRSHVFGQKVKDLQVKRSATYAEKKGDRLWALPKFETRITHMAREVRIGQRTFYIVSEPGDRNWKAQVLEVDGSTGDTITVGIETVGSTRSEADERALGALQNRLRETVGA